MQAQIKVVNPLAQFPKKGTVDSVGYDLTAISVYKKLSEKTALYDTGLQVKPPEGFYFEIIPRSSLSKSGYVLSNSVGIIDPDYRGNLLIALTKVDDSQSDLKLPCTVAQLILRKKWDCEFIQVEELNETDRGDGGFGSTDTRRFRQLTLEDVNSPTYPDPAASSACPKEQGSA